MIKGEQRYELYNGDCFDYVSGMPDRSVDCLLSDIPYGEVNKEQDGGFAGYIRMTKGSADTADFDLGKLVREFARVTRGTVCFFCGTKQISTCLSILEQEGFITRIIVLEKTNPALVNARYVPLSAVEVAVYGKRPGTTFNGNCVPNVFRYPNSQCQYHPTEKQVGLFQEMVRLFSNVDDIIFDPMCGSGTTGVAAFSLGRKFIGCEINDEWFNIAKDRIEEASHQQAEMQCQSRKIGNNKSAKEKLEKWRRCQLLAQQGYSKSQIAQTVKLDWATVSKYLSLSQSEFEASSACIREYKHSLDGYETIISDKIKREPTLSAAQVFRWFRDAYPDVKVSQRTMYNFLRCVVGK